VNSVNLIGRLTRDPELRYTQSSTAVCNFTLAVDRRKKDDGADFVDCVAWAKTAELVSQYLGKGRLCAVSGRIQVRSYEATDGGKRKAVEVVVENVQFLDKPKAQGEVSEAAAAFNDDDIPF